MINKRRSFIIGIKSHELTSKEKKFLRKYKPWGVILFSRNIKNNNHPIEKNYSGPIDEIIFISSLPVLRKNLQPY